MVFTNILVAYDASEYSNRAFKNALKIAESNQSKITITSVITGVYQPSIGFTIKFAEEELKKQKKFLKKIYTELESQAKKKGVKISFKILNNPSVSKAIINFSNEKKIDLVVIGSHGRTGFSRVILGSVANAVLHHEMPSNGGKIDGF